ncbi:Ribose-5-phosphate isomerase B [Legionella massiliensis]|uniref:Ribose-5-phosphate isomerase B n=1 Tax=Legionella massiliensis TaxID=1034943 RepID=A0A078KTA2_9GAMM|nr:RpiB/LacA/LacB family sugar-phosphate isomerase [Legionella massiliensis]CDZ76296.1 Ribose-5-phosphate isomerase B [Legionella massiliensis]CEE12034.1 Ribose-5-phosphate isomerase B [Legionella massiliensis]
MRIAVGSDEHYPVNDFVVKELARLGHEVILFGALKSGKEEPWIQAAQEAAEAVFHEHCEEGIFFCWTGTGTAIVANKIPGIRAALCTDAQTAAGARKWNKANVLVLSNRLLSQDVAKEILASWFGEVDETQDDTVETIKALEESYR